MSKKDYFKFLKKNLPNDSYKGRFLEELDDHFEDALYAESIRKQTPEEKVLDRMGDPNETILYYKKLMSKQSKLYPFFESFFWGILSTPLYILLFIANGFTEETEVLLFKGAIYVLTAAVLGGFFYAFYRFVFFNLKPLNQLLSQEEKKISFVLNLTPAFLLTLLSILNFYSMGVDERQDYLFPIVIAGYLLAILVCAWKAFVHSFTKKNRMLSSPLLVYLLVLLLLAFFAISDFIWVLLYFSKVAWTILFIGHIKLAIFSSGFLLVILGLFCLESLRRWIKDRHQAFPLLKMIFLVAVVYLLVGPLPTRENAAELNWSKPVVELSEVLEKKEMGPFYLWSKKFRADDGPSIWYSVFYKENGFAVQMENMAEYSLNPSSTTELNLERVSGDFDAHVQENIILHEDLTCVLTTMAAENWDPTQIPVLGGETDCKEFYFKDQLIFSRTDGGWFMLDNAVISSDEEWLLLQFQNTTSDPIELYLVQLQ